MEEDDISHLPEREQIQVLHIPMQNKDNVYDTQSPKVRAWLANVFRQLVPLELPILLHCKSGRDRTGVVVAAFLLILGIPKEAIKQEFLLTEGAKLTELQKALDGLTDRKGGIDEYFEMLDLEALRNCYSLSHIVTSRRLLYQEALRAKGDEDARFYYVSLLEVCQRGLTLKPDDAEMHAGVGWSLIRLGRREEAQIVLREGLRLAARCDVKPAIVKMMQHELETCEIRACEGAVQTPDSDEQG
jgi:hypothetical protein